MLTEKQKRFINEYMVDLNGTQAAIRAGYSAKTARAIASETLKKPAVAARIASRKKRRFQRTLEQEFQHFEAMWRVAMADPNDLFDKDGNLKPPEEWSDSARLCISDYNIVETFASVNGGRKKLVRRETHIEVQRPEGKVRALIFLDKKLNPVRAQEPSAPTELVQFKGFLTPAEARQYYPTDWPAILERQWVRFDEFEKVLLRQKMEKGSLDREGQILLDLILRDKQERPQVRRRADAWRQRSSAQTGNGSITPLK